MRNETKSTNSSARSPRDNAFTPEFLSCAQAVPRPGDVAHADLATLAVDPAASGPWVVEPVTTGHGPAWVVVREGESYEDGAAVAVIRCRITAALTAAILPALAIPNHLRFGEHRRPCGLPLHDGAHFLGHLAPRGPAHHAALVHHLHTARTLLTQPESLVTLVRAYAPEAIQLLGRALARTVET